MNKNKDYKNIKDDTNSPEHRNKIAKAKIKSNHRIMHFELTIRLIREMLVKIFFS